VKILKKVAGCPFCEPEKDSSQNIVFENEFCMYLQHSNQQDILEGSGLIVPKKHRQTVFDLTAEEWAATYELMQQVKTYADSRYSPDGYTLGWNVGEASNQSILHAHFHILPRFADEPFAGKGIRAWFKSEENRRPGR
jgi:diadenosine tetraphosphate (Ap4A) HIT family hydrolase